jgi:hypothetical protein
MALIAVEWGANALEEAKETNDIAIERRANPQTPKRIKKISTGFYLAYLEQKMGKLPQLDHGSRGVPLTYLI